MPGNCLTVYLNVHVIPIVDYGITTQESWYLSEKMRVIPGFGEVGVRVIGLEGSKGNLLSNAEIVKNRFGYWYLRNETRVISEYCITLVRNIRGALEFVRRRKSQIIARSRNGRDCLILFYRGEVFVANNLGEDFVFEAGDRTIEVLQYRRYKKLTT
ncbi:MAG: hypothetical protein ABIK73_06625 [candidate division WOR-3 bacterium]